MWTKVSISFSYNFGVLDKHLQMHFLFGHLNCVSMTAQASASALQMNIGAVCDGTCPCSLSGSLCPGRSWCHSPTFCCCIVTHKCSKQSAAPSTPLQQWTRQLYCKESHLLPPTANLPLHLYVVLMINKNNYIWVSHWGGFIHSFSL